LSNRYSVDEILNFASALEGHPDNVAPALFGGIRASGVFPGGVKSVPVPVPALKAVVAVPAFQLSTKKARAILPKSVPMKDAVKNLSAVALLTHAFRNDPSLLGTLLNDRLHEPYRARLIPGFYRVKASGLKAGALGVILSGAGPSMLAFAPQSAAARIAKAMRTAFTRAGVRSEAYIFDIDKKGAKVT
jgi:homoserine kinase